MAPFRLVFGVSLLALGLSQGVHAQTPSVPPSAHGPFQPSLLTGRDRDSFLFQFRAMVEWTARDRQGLDARDAEEFEAISLGRARGQQLARTLEYDINGDGSVSRDEVEAAARRGGFMVAETAKTLSTVMALDKNKDGTVSFEEMWDVQPPPTNSQAKRVRDLLALDPNGDGRLTLEEAVRLAEVVWACYDTDGSGVLERGERATLGFGPDPGPGKTLVQQQATPKCEGV